MNNDRYGMLLGVGVASTIIASIIVLNIAIPDVFTSSSTEEDNNDPEIPGLENYTTPYTIITPSQPYHTYEQESNVSIIINPNITGELK